MIQWLNKELNDAQSGVRPYSSLAPSRASTFRPSVPSSLKPSSPPSKSAAEAGGAPFATLGSSRGGTAAELSKFGADGREFKGSPPTGSSGGGGAEAAGGALGSSTGHVRALRPTVLADAATYDDVEERTTSHVPGAALASLRSRAGKALVDGAAGAERALSRSGETASTANTTSSAFFSDYLSPSAAGGGVPLSLS